MMDITGQAGGATARHRLDNGQRTRLVVRDRARAPAWAGALSSVGVQGPRDLGLITRLQLLEQALDALPRAHMRAAWFVGKLRPEVALAQREGRLARLDMLESAA
ncbi:hypothetical protein ACFPME_04680 [Rhodanobacter umsongensis]|uniref:Uncharacterized protein n=1 Tax=Rhodanobacter umsongensis TaxID=633153 RepID=A0ABW0JJC4_9GAMM